MIIHEVADQTSGAPLYTKTQSAAELTGCIRRRKRATLDHAVDLHANVEKLPRFELKRQAAFVPKHYRHRVRRQVFNLLDNAISGSARLRDCRICDFAHLKAPFLARPAPVRLDSIRQTKILKRLPKRAG
ncbi:MAG TPA: hypothetical protein PKG98_11125 [Myxococcota bacterium]|nr:hypothetical protein [Myxococcota bacterium]